MTKRLKFASVALIAVLIGASLSALHWKEEYREDRRAEAQLNMIASNLRDYVARSGRLPGDDVGLNLLVTAGQVPAEMLIDPWGQAVKYKCQDPSCESARISSLGDPKNATRHPIVRSVP